MALTYYFYSDGNCTTSTCRLEAGFVFSLDGGSRWSDPIVLTSNPMPLSWVASTGQGAMVGDYVSTSFSEAATVAVFSAADPKDTSFHQAIYAATPVVPRSTGSTTTTSTSTIPSSTTTTSSTLPTSSTTTTSTTVPPGVSCEVPPTGDATAEVLPNPVVTVDATTSGREEALSRTGTNTYRMVGFAALALILGFCLVRTAQYCRYAAPWYRRRR